MPLQNRVTPFSELVAHPARGLLYGNRGCMHDDQRAHPPALRHAALDRVPAGVPRLGARPEAAARALHRAVLPRRGDGVRRRPSPVRALPPRRLRAPGRDLARAPSGSGRSRRDRPPAARRARRAGHAGAAATTGRRSATSPTARSSCATASPGSCCGSRAAALDARGLRRAHRAAAGRRGDRDHATLAGGRAARRMGAARAAVPSLDLTTETFGIGKDRPLASGVRKQTGRRAQVAPGRWYSCDGGFHPDRQGGTS